MESRNTKKKIAKKVERQVQDGEEREKENAKDHNIAKN